MYKRELQVIDSQEKAYLLGLFFADGNIGINKDQCRIQLKIDDEDLIFHLKKVFPFFYIHYAESPFNGKFFSKIELGAYKKHIKEDLILNGVLPRKSFENKDKVKIPLLSDRLLWHFIRGYFDGNGGCTLSNSSGKQQKRVYIYSPSLNFLKEISKFLEKNQIENSITKSSVVYKLSISSIEYKKFYEKLYQNADIFLKRKRQIFDSILKTNFFIQRKSIPCKFCTSISTVNDGYCYYKGKKQRYLCKSCKRHFTAPNNSNIIGGGDELLEN